jgi:hypothetical protein
VLKSVSSDTFLSLLLYLILSRSSVVSNPISSLH